MPARANETLAEIQASFSSATSAVIVYDVQNLVKYYPGQAAPANKEITLQIYEREIFGILGDNGAGKNTLVRQMVNLTLQHLQQHYLGMRNHRCVTLGDT